MMFSSRLKPYLAVSGALVATMFATTTHAASVSFVEQASGPVLVTHDNNDWTTFSFTSTKETATADATLFKFSNQGNLGDGTEVIFLKDSNGAISDLLTAKIHVINSSAYSVHYEFFSDSAIPSIIPHSTGRYTDVSINGETAYVGLQSFSHAIALTSLTAVPETQSSVMMVIGLGLMGTVMRHRKAA
jgi:hypothetical protein